MKDPTIFVENKAGERVSRKVTCTLIFNRTPDGNYLILYVDRKFGGETRVTIKPIQDLKAAVRRFHAEIKFYDESFV
jgi:hypothetical protein